MCEYSLLFEVNKNDFIKWQNTSISMSKPKVLNIMETDGTDLITPNHLRYFKMPQIYPLDLNSGYELYKIRPDKCFFLYLRKMENYIVNNERLFLSHYNYKQRICTSKRVLITIMSTPYKLENNWRIKVINFRNTIYIANEACLPGKKTPHGTYHFTFQKYCFAETPFTEPKIDVPVDESKQLTCAFYSCLKNFDIYYAAEIGGLEASQEVKMNKEELNKCSFVTTKLMMKTKFHNWKKNPIFLICWLQSYLARVDTMYIGFKTNDGFVEQKPKILPIQDIPKNQNWKPRVCETFLYQTLINIRLKMANIDCPYTTYIFQYNSKISEIEYRVFEGKSKESFLSDDFVNYMKKA